MWQRSNELSYTEICLNINMKCKLKVGVCVFQESVLLTSEVQFKAFTGVICIADELQPHGTRGGVEGCLEQLIPCKHPQQTSLVAAAVKDLKGVGGNTWIKTHHVCTQGYTKKAAYTRGEGVSPPKPSL